MKQNLEDTSRGFKGALQTWVTSAVTDEEAIQAIVLRCSLQKMGTNRTVHVLISDELSQATKDLLFQAFEGKVMIIAKDEIQDFGLSKVGLDLVVKLWCYKLTQYSKCVYLTSNHYLALKLADDIFNSEKFSTGQDEPVRQGPFFVCEPNFIMFKNIVQQVVTAGKVPIVFPTVQKATVGINLGAEIKTPEPAFLRFETQPWLLTGNGYHQMEAAKWLQIYIQDIVPLFHRKEYFNLITAEIGKKIDSVSTELFINNNEDDLRDTVAIIGLSCRLPGANNAAEYWKLLSEGREAIRKFPAERAFSGPIEARDMHAGFLNCPIDEFDATFFGISPREAVMMDPQQRLLLEVTWECLEHAGINPQSLRDSDTSVYVGMWKQDYESIILDAIKDEDNLEARSLHQFLGNQMSATASRISFCMGFHGPAVSVESGCSSALSGLHLACQSLKAKETSLALVSGVNLVLLPLDPFNGKILDKNGIVLSSDYKCKTFDESADGFVRAEACGVVALKRYQDALRDGDNVLAIVRGSAINNDGTSTSFGTPSAKAQEMVYRAALKRAQVTPDRVSYLETHGTGTSVGDPIEMQAVGRVYSESRKDPLLVGSVKTNIGHCEAGAGIASLIKVILCMEHGQIPPHRNLKTLNPKIDLDSIPACIPMKLTSWTADTKIAGISAFSMSSTNAHVIVQEPPKLMRPSAINDAFGVETITLSAKSEEALTTLVDRYICFLRDNRDISLKEFCYCTNLGRAHFPHRIAAVATSTQELILRLEERDFIQGKAFLTNTKIAFLFTGQGSQYLGMSNGLCEAFPVFKKAMELCESLFQTKLEQSLYSVVYKDESLLSQSLYCQPAIFCIEYCLVQLWKSFGINPHCVLGHSVGEFAAAVCAGILSLEDALELVIARSRLVNNLPTGCMLALRASEDQTIELIKIFEAAFESAEHWADIAAVNSDEEVVVSVNAASVKKFEDFCKSNGTKFIRIPATHAFHSRAMDPILTKYGQLADAMSTSQPNCTYISGTLARCMAAEEFCGAYWQRHLRDTVRFSEALRVVWSDCKVLIEIGAQPILLGLAMANVGDSKGSALFCPSLRRNEEASASFSLALKKLYVSGVELDWKMVHGVRQKTIHLPTYPFEGRKYWIGNGTEQSAEVNPVLHPLLGREFPSPLPQTIFHQTLKIKELPYLDDHKVAGFVVVPAAALLETFLASIREVLHGNTTFPITIENFIVHALTPFESSNLQTLVTSGVACGGRENELMYEITLNRTANLNSAKWKCHASAQYQPSAAVAANIELLDLPTLKSNLRHEESLVLAYKALSEIGIQFGPTFRSIKSLWHGPNDALAEIHLPKNYESYICHPIVLDAMIQTCAFRQNFSGLSSEEQILRLPVGIKKFTWHSRPSSRIMYAHYTQDTESVTLYDDNGLPLAALEGLDMIPTTVSSILRAIHEETQEMPQLTCDRWRPLLGKMDFRVDIGQLNSLTLDSPKVLALAKSVDTKEAEFEELVGPLEDAAFYIFCKGIQDCAWLWPSVGETLYPEQWEPFLPKNINPRILVIYFFELETRGYLKEVDINTYKVVKSLPTILQCEEILTATFNSTKSSKEDISVEAAFAERYRTCFPLILKSEMTPLTFLFPEDPAEHGAMYYYNNSLSYRQQNSRIVELLSETVSQFQDNVPKRDGILRILEIGAGSGSTTFACMETLKKLNIPFHYTFTDMGQIFLSEAKKKFGHGPELSYKVFNIENDPLAQGFSPEEFDLIIGLHVLHATARIDESLANLKQVLKLGGALILGEAFHAYPGSTFTFGMLDGWWRFDDFRLNSKMTALANVEQWTTCLRKAQFDSIFSVGCRFGAVLARNATRFNSEELFSTPRLNWLVITEFSKLSRAIFKELKRNCREVVASSCRASDVTQTFHKTMDGDVLEGILCLLTEFESDDIVTIQKNIVETLLTILQAYEANADKFKQPPKLVVVTRGVYSIGDSEAGNPHGATAWGIMKSFRSENHNAPISLIDLDSESSEFETSQVLAQLWNQQNEFFIAFRQKETFTLRLSPLEKQILPIKLPSTDRYKFINPPSGAFSDIDIGPATRENLSEDEVEIEVRACALNFRDLFMVMKPEGFELPLDEGGNPSEAVGFDVSGVVVALGPKVKRLKVGDEVYGISRNGSLRSHVVTSETRLMIIPCGMTFTEASTIPCTFLTVFVSFVALAKITANDRVLIHVASGGVGLAAIQVAKSIGAEIYATAGNKRKRAYLRSLGVKYVYNSRDTSYGKGIERDTNGTGVTVVLNSLTGTGFKEMTLECCGTGARFVEIGKINIWKSDQVKLLRPDVRYYSIDLNDLEDLRMKLTNEQTDMQTMTLQLEKAVLDGGYKGLPNVRYSLSRIREAFHRFQKAQHIGKIVVQMPWKSISNSGKIEHQHLIFNSKSTYMITGGLGGIGIEVTKWMISMGARSIVLVGRSLPGESVQRLIENWNCNGSNIVVVQTDIGCHENCVGTLELIMRLSLPPLRGIMHAAGILSDATVAQQTLRKFETVFRPKVFGGWYLHCLTLEYQLEFFVMFSSMSGIMGMIGQANHGAANRFLDSLTHLRISMGLPATSINWGGWSDVGAAAQIGMTSESIIGMRIFTPLQGIAALEHIMSSPHAQVGVADLPDGSVIKAFFSPGNYADEVTFMQQEGEAVANFEILLEGIRLAKSPKDQLEKIQLYVEAVVKETLTLPAGGCVDLDQTFDDLGVDSLMAMEMKNRLQVIPGETNLSISAIQENRTIRSISFHIASLLMEN